MEKEPEKRVVVVAGDVTMDWNLARIGQTKKSASVWSLNDSVDIYWQRGGTSLLADLIEAVGADLVAEKAISVTIRQPAVPRLASEAIPGDPNFHQSFAIWSEKKYAEKLGVKIDELLISQPDTGEQALEITDMLVRSAAVDVVIIDSVAALTPKAEIEGEMGDTHVGLQARLMSQALRKLTANIKRSNTLVIFINQIRMKIGVMFGSPETTTGGNALKFYASVRLDIRRTGAIKKGEETMGSETRVKVVKNKVAPPFKMAEFDILYNEGISRESEIINLATQLGLIEKSGAWYSYNQEKIGQGKENVRLYLKENTKLAALLEQQIRAEYLVKKVPVAEAMDEVIEE